MTGVEAPTAVPGPSPITRSPAELRCEQDIQELTGRHPGTGGNRESVMGRLIRGSDDVHGTGENQVRGLTYDEFVEIMRKHDKNFTLTRQAWLDLTAGAETIEGHDQLYRAFAQLRRRLDTSNWAASLQSKFNLWRTRKHFDYIGGPRPAGPVGQAGPRLDPIAVAFKQHLYELYRQGQLRYYIEKNVDLFIEAFRQIDEERRRTNPNYQPPVLLENESAEAKVQYVWQRLRLPGEVRISTDRGYQLVGQQNDIDYVEFEGRMSGTMVPAGQPTPGNKQKITDQDFQTMFALMRNDYSEQLYQQTHQRIDHVRLDNPFLLQMFLRGPVAAHGRGDTDYQIKLKEYFALQTRFLSLTPRLQDLIAKINYSNPETYAKVIKLLLDLSLTNDQLEKKLNEVFTQAEQDNTDMLRRHNLGTVPQ